MAQYDKRENTQCNARVTAHGEGPRRRARRGCFAAACTHGFTRRTADLVTEWCAVARATDLEDTVAAERESCSER